MTGGQGPVLIVAGAGTGKTTVITNRIAYLIEKKKVKPEQIVALTFTEKAAEEMEDRVDDLISFSYLDLWISTFHSFAQRILQEHGLDIGLATDFKLLDEAAIWRLMRKNLKRFNLDYYKPVGNPTKFINALINHFSRCKDQAIYPKEYLRYAKTLKGEEKKRVKEVAQAYKAYQDLLLDNNCLDFGDLINYCLRLLKERPLVLKEYHQQFKYILVDEFQDTNWAQYELIKLLSKPANNLTVCADDDQSIYKFRGASFSNIIQFRRDFPKARQIALRENHRSYQNILDLAHQFIELNNPNRLEYLDKINKHLIAVKKGKGTIEHLHFNNVQSEAVGVINRIVTMLRTDKKANFNDFAILVRANNYASIFSQALERARIPYQFMALRGLYSKPVVLDVVAFFRLLDDYHESSALYRIFNLPFLKIPEKDIAKITQYSRRKAISFYQAVQNKELLNTLSKTGVKRIKYILKLIERQSQLTGRRSVSEIFISFLSESGYLKYLTNEKDEEAINYLNQFADRIKSFEEASLEPILRNFMEELNMEIESGEEGKLKFDIEQGPDAVRLMTVHAAKGLEFKYVFLVNLVDKRFPVVEKKDPIEIPPALIKDIVPKGDPHLEEERRLFYVAMTRAKESLFFSSADDYGGVSTKKLSRFLKELGYSKQEDNQKLRPEDIFLKERLPQRGSKKKKLALPNFFSFTQLRAFETCPLQYKFAHILKIPIRGKANFSYGKTMHNTLAEFLEMKENGKVDFRDLKRIYKKNWIDDWYEDEEQKNKYYQMGEKALKIFYERLKKEKPQLLTIGDKPALEKNFNLKIDGETFIGKIDRIDVLKEDVEIIDYKTGKAQKKLKPGDKEQLLIYQMAVRDAFGLKPHLLSYYFLDEGEKLSFLGEEKDIEKEREKIISQMKEIKKSKFPAKPGWHCKYCDFRDICEFSQ